MDCFCGSVSPVGLQNTYRRPVILAGLDAFLLMGNSPAIYYYVVYLRSTRDELAKSS